MPENIKKLIQNNDLWLASEPMQHSKCSWMQATSKKVTRARPSVPFTIPAIDSTLADKGLSFGAIHEFVYQSQHKEKRTAYPYCLSTLLLLNSMAQLYQTKSKSHKLSFWISNDDFPAPFLLWQLLVGRQLNSDLLNELIFLSVKNTTELLWVVDTLLCSKAVANVIAPIPTISFATERRFALRAKNNNIFALFLRTPQVLRRASAAQSRWLIQAKVSTSNLPRWDIRLLQQKGAQSTQRNWEVELTRQVGKLLFQEVTAEPAHTTLERKRA